MTKLFGFTPFIAATVIYGQQSALDSQSMHEQHMHEQLTTEKAMADQHDGINSRGDQAMGFSHENTTHHFLLRSDGGVIAIEANDLSVAKNPPPHRIGDSSCDTTSSSCYDSSLIW